MRETQPPDERSLTAALRWLYGQGFQISLDTTDDSPQRAYLWSRDPSSGVPIRVHVQFGTDGYRITVEEVLPGQGLHTRFDQLGGWGELDPCTVATQAIELAGDLDKPLSKR